MEKIAKISLLGCLIGLATMLFPLSLTAKEFVVVIDPGHGGKDPGAVGKVAKEKIINLNVALQLGKLIEQNCKDTKVIYTRKTDVFVALNKRADIANKAQADLFISIHTNAVEKGRTVRGTETYTLGLSRSDANLELAKRENAVIYIEEGYEEKYAGFDPRSSESYIIFEFIQDKYMEKSVKMAKLVQDQFRMHAKRNDRGVHQAGFLVLRATTMPSILVELGYISTPDEERYLNSREGNKKLAEGIFNAFLSYKEEQLKPLKEIKSPEKEATNTASSKENEQVPVFKIQYLTSANLLKEGDKRLKGIAPVSYYKEKGLYKYTYMESTDYNEMLRARKDISDRFKDAFIIAFKNGEKMNIQEAIKEFKQKSKQ